MKVFCKNIPTYNADTKEWTTTSFVNQEYFGKFLLDNCFKEPGEYEFDPTVHQWGILGKYWEEHKIYTLHPDNTKAYLEFWDKEELKCRLGVLWHSGDKVWYITRDYYFFLNYCPIINKEKGQEESMATVRDVQYHMSLYEKLAEIHHKHSAILKRRQMLYSFLHVAKTANFLYFENKKTLKWFASDDGYIDDVNGSWKILNAYKNHLSKYTAWDKVFSPDSYPQLQQKEKIKIQGRWITDGNESTLVARTLNRDPKKGVGGPCAWAWYEEGGIAPTADTTLQYMNPALESGNEKVGSFCIGGSVGDLKECKPLEKMVKDPDAYEMFGVPTKWWDESGVEKIAGLFIPAQYGMPQAVDDNGNSLVELALQILDEQEEQWKKLPEKDYILRKSQNPRNMKEAFAYRDVTKWPMRRMEKRQLYIKDNKIQPKRVELEENDKGDVSWKLSDKEDIPYPVDKKAKDKSGVVLMWKEPDARFKHYGGVDNIEVGVTETSDSLFSIYIVRGIAEIEYEEEGRKRIRQEGIQIVASWTGRLDSVDQTNDYAIMLMKLYNTKVLCERNKPNFINRCQQKGIAVKYLIKEAELPFNKEMDFSKEYTSNEYGIYMDSTGKKQLKCDDYGIEYMQEELDCVYKKDKDGNYTSEKLKVFYGIDRIDDYWLLEECKYVGKENTDRENAWRLAVVAAKVYEIQGIKSKVTEVANTTRPEKRIRTINLLGNQGTGYTQRKNKKQRGFNLLR